MHNILKKNRGMETFGSGQNKCKKLNLGKGKDN